MMPDYYDRQGKPMTLLQWAERFEDANYKRVAEDVVGGVRVSTVWMGLDHSFTGKRMIFETMVFGGDLDGEQVRYSTLKEAIDGHAEMVKRVAAASEKR